MGEYDIPITEFLPSITVCDSFDDTVIHASHLHCNSPDHWHISFRQFNADGTVEEHLPVDCKELVDSWTEMPEAERTEIKNEFLFSG